MNGILLLNKPLGMTSNQAVQKVRWLFDAKKAGHTGTLDPLATGLLIICLGEATKYSQYLLDADKAYETTAHLGVKTTTGDKEGEVIETKPVPVLSDAALDAVLAQFSGEIQQTPSMYSALKHNGTPLYALARAGKTAPVPTRTVQIHTLQRRSRNNEQLSLFVRCSKGTYIRSLVEDIGETLGCGAHVSQLHRTQVGPFSASDMLTFEQIEAMPARTQALQPLTRLVSHFPEITLDDSAVTLIQQGQRLSSEAWAAFPAEHPLQLYHATQGFIGLGHCVSGQLKGLRLLSTVGKPL